MIEYKASDLSKRLDVHPNTIRSWADEYGAFLSPGALGRAPGAKRRFTHDDAVLLATVADLRNDGLNFEAVHKALSDGRRVDSLPELPTPEEEEARRGIALVPLPEYQNALDNLRRLTSERDRLAVELQQAIDDRITEVQTYSERLQAVERELSNTRERLGELRGRLQIIAAAGVLLLAVLIIALAAVLLAG